MLKKGLKNIQVRTGFEPMTSALPVQRSSVFVNLFSFSSHRIPTKSVASFSAYKPNRSDEGQTLETTAFKLFTVANLQGQPGG